MENIVNSVMNGYGQESAFIVTCVSPVDANTKKRLCRIGELAQTMSTAVHQHAAQFVPSDRPSATQGAAGSEAVGKLPLEEFCTEDDLLKKGVRELKELLKAAQDARKASTFGTQEKHPPIEKKELVAAVHRVQQAGEAESICAICLDEYKSGDTLRVLPCAHRFHCICVDRWLASKSRECPLCKHGVQ